MEEYIEGDMVAVFGGELNRDSRAADSITFCKVKIVGQGDLVVENTSFYTTTYHTVPKSICSKMYLDPQILATAKTLEPEIGDLVVSFSRAGEELGKKSGILCKIMYKLGRPDRCELLCGTDAVNVGWDTLVVIRRD